MNTIRRNKSKSDTVVLLQNLLKKAGYDKAGYDIVADGAFGPKTDAAVKTSCQRISLL